MIETLLVKLPYFDLADAEVVTAGLRPIRKSGIRFEEEKIK